MLVAPYVKMTSDSTNSAVQIDETLLGWRFHAQPREEKAPQYRAKVRSPYQRKIEPLMMCARQLCERKRKRVDELRVGGHAPDDADGARRTR